jgi:hypothetical protein
VKGAAVEELGGQSHEASWILTLFFLARQALVHAEPTYLSCPLNFMLANILHTYI